jgi:hypothetical protein
MEDLQQLLASFITRLNLSTLNQIGMGEANEKENVEEK